MWDCVPLQLTGALSYTSTSRDRLQQPHNTERDSASSENGWLDVHVGFQVLEMILEAEKFN